MQRYRTRLAPRLCSAIALLLFFLLPSAVYGAKSQAKNKIFKLSDSDGAYCNLAKDTGKVFVRERSNNAKKFCEKSQTGNSGAEFYFLEIASSMNNTYDAEYIEIEDPELKTQLTKFCAESVKVNQKEAVFPGSQACTKAKNVANPDWKNNFASGDFVLERSPVGEANADIPSAANRCEAAIKANDTGSHDGVKESCADQWIDSIEDDLKTDQKNLDKQLTELNAGEDSDGARYSYQLDSYSLVMEAINVSKELTRIASTAELLRKSSDKLWKGNSELLDSIEKNKNNLSLLESAYADSIQDRFKPTGGVWYVWLADSKELIMISVNSILLLLILWLTLKRKINGNRSATASQKPQGFGEEEDGSSELRADLENEKVPPGSVEAPSNKDFSMLSAESNSDESTVDLGIERHDKAIPEFNEEELIESVIDLYSELDEFPQVGDSNQSSVPRVNNTHSSIGQALRTLKTAIISKRTQYSKFEADIKTRFKKDGEQKLDALRTELKTESDRIKNNAVSLLDSEKQSNTENVKTIASLNSDINQLNKDAEEKATTIVDTRQQLVSEMQKSKDEERKLRALKTIFKTQSQNLISSFENFQKGVEKANYGQDNVQFLLPSLEENIQELAEMNPGALKKYFTRKNSGGELPGYLTSLAVLANIRYWNHWLGLHEPIAAQASTLLTDFEAVVNLKGARITAPDQFTACRKPDLFGVDYAKRASVRDHHFTSASFYYNDSEKFFSLIQNSVLESTGLLSLGKGGDTAEKIKLLKALKVTVNNEENWVDTMSEIGKSELCGRVLRVDSLGLVWDDNGAPTELKPNFLFF